MQMRKLIKIAPIVLAFIVLVPIGVMAANPTVWHSGTDSSTLSSSGTASWNQYINQHLSNVPVNDTFSWYNQLTNFNSTTATPDIACTDTWTGNIDVFRNIPSIPQNYQTNVFSETTQNEKAVNGGYIWLGIVHQYWTNGPSVLNSDQSYTAS